MNCIMSICQGFMKNHMCKSYGSDVYPNFNEQLSREKYIQIFGEEPLDLLYILGAVYDGSIVLN